jgi:hypothetical protein
MRGFGGFGVTLLAFAWYEVLAVNPRDPNRLAAYDVFSGDLKFSTTGVDEWTESPGSRMLVTQGDTLLANIGRQSLVTTVSMCPEAPGNMLAGAAQGGMYHSGDGGRSWAAIPGSKGVTVATSVHWNSAHCDEAIVSTYGRGLWRLNMRRHFDIAIAEPCAIFFDIRCFLRLDLGTIVDQGEALRFDRGFVVLNGRITALSYQGGIIKNVSVTPGSTLVGLGKEPFVGLTKIKESAQLGSFSGVKGLRKLVQQGLVVQGVAFQGTTPTQLVVGKGMLALKPIPVRPLTQQDVPQSGIHDRPYLWLLSKLNMGGVSVVEAGEKLRVDGGQFKFDAREPLELRVDNRPIAKINPSPNGTFRLDIDTVGLAQGPHQVTAVKLTESQAVVIDASTFVVQHRDEGKQR